jgi:hypothetical protein
MSELVKTMVEDNEDDDDDDDNLPEVPLPNVKVRFSSCDFDFCSK